MNFSACLHGSYSSVSESLLACLPNVTHTQLPTLVRSSMLVTAPVQPDVVLSPSSSTIRGIDRLFSHGLRSATIPSARDVHFPFVFFFPASKDATFLAFLGNPYLNRAAITNLSR